jgi:hypothetical protein
MSYSGQTVNPAQATMHVDFPDPHGVRGSCTLPTTSKPHRALLFQKPARLAGTWLLGSGGPDCGPGSFDCTESAMWCPYEENANPNIRATPAPSKTESTAPGKKSAGPGKIYTHRISSLDDCGPIRPFYAVEFSGHTKSGARLAAELLPWNWFADHQRISPLY